MGGYPTPLEDSLMATYMYDSNVTIIGGWKLSTIEYYNRDDKQTGLKATIFERELKERGREYAYVYAGTVDMKVGKITLIKLLINQYA